MARHHVSRGTLAFAFALLVSAPAIADSKEAAAGSDAGLWERSTLTGDWGGLRKSLEEAGAKFALSEQSELWSNFAGGMRTGNTYDGLTTGSLTLDLEKLLDWKGATFFVNGFQIHGHGPSTVLVGNQQHISNIEAAPSTRLYQLWVEQQLFGDRVTVRAGQAGAEEFAASQAAQLFINASFGFPDVLAQDLPSGGPTYPLATPMVRATIKVTDGITYMGAIFNGDPAGSGEGAPDRRNAKGTAFRLNDPPLIFNEIWFSVGADRKSGLLPGTYKIGSWVHSGSFNDQSRDIHGLPLLSNSQIAARYHGNYGFYAVADQMIWRKAGTKDQGVTVFGLVMGAPDDRNPESFFAEGGFTWKGAIESRPDDTFGVGVAYARTSDALRRSGEESIAFTGTGKLYASNETVIEATYLYQAAPWWTIQLDLQYVINPGASLPPTGPGIDMGLKDSLAAGIRTKIDF